MLEPRKIPVPMIAHMRLYSFEKLHNPTLLLLYACLCCMLLIAYLLAVHWQSQGYVWRLWSQAQFAITEVYVLIWLKPAERDFYKFCIPKSILNASVCIDPAPCNAALLLAACTDLNIYWKYGSDSHLRHNPGRGGASKTIKTKTAFYLNFFVHFSYNLKDCMTSCDLLKPSYSRLDLGLVQFCSWRT